MIKGKVKLCETPLSAFNIEKVHDAPFFERYNEFVHVFKVNGVEDVEQLFAQPLYNHTSKKIEWFIPTPEGEYPLKFSSLSDDEKPQYEAVLAETINRLKSINDGSKPIDSVYFSCALKYIDNVKEYVYCHNGQITFGLGAWVLEVDTT